MKIKYFISLFLLPLLVFPFKSDTNTAKDSIETKRWFYKDGIVSVERWYGSDKKIDSLKTYYNSGNKNEIFYFNDKGKYDGECVQFGKNGGKKVTWTFRNGKLLNRVDHKVVFNKKNETKIKKYHAILNQVNRETNYKPKSFNDIFRRANMRYRLGNYTLALKDFLILEKQIKKLEGKKTLPDKIKTNIYDNLGAIYGSFEQENKALHYKNKAVITVPDDGRLLYNLASYLYEINAYRLSIHYLNETKKIWPKHAFSHWILGAIYSDLDENEKAMKSVNIAYKREKNLIKYGTGNAERDIRTIRGLLYHKLGDSEKGIVDLTESLKINKDNSFALRNLGVIYHDLGEYDKSCELLKKAKKLNYETIHDRKDLQYYLDNSCSQNTDTNIEKLSERPYIYPNPVSDVLNIKNFNEPTFEFEIYNYSSELIKKGTSNSSAINISEFDSGVYILKIVNGKSFLTFRIIKK